MSNYLITGANGFLGKIICNELSRGNSIYTLSRSQSDINVDLSRSIPEFNAGFDVVVHAAGLAHTIAKSQSEADSFFNVNAIGTSNLLKGLENDYIPKSFVFISSVAVYGVETGHMIHEGVHLDAKDPYGKSKIVAELTVQDWCRKNNVLCTILRLPLLVGQNPPGNLGTMIKGIRKGYYFNIGGGKARKSMVLAEDVAKIIPIAATVGGIYNLTDGYHPCFSELSEVIASKISKPKPMSIPKWTAKSLALFGDLIGPKSPFNSQKLNKILSDLIFDDSKARSKLKWSPTNVLKGLKI